MIVLYSIFFIYLLFIVTWIFYLAFMNLKNHRDKLHPVLRKLIAPWLPVGLVLDALFNIVYGTIVFRELPKEWLFTSRCQRHLLTSSPKINIAVWHCKHLLDPFEMGGHC